MTYERQGDSRLPTNHVQEAPGKLFLLLVVVRDELAIAHTELLARRLVDSSPQKR
jgi:hypothetical protein